MILLPPLQTPHFPLATRDLAAYILLGVSILIFAIFWIWSMVHAARTPRAPWVQRLLWFCCLFLNPTATIWYWCVWKRWAFWTLFTPLLGIFLAAPFAVRSLMTKADATVVTNGLFALGSNGLVIFFAVLLIFPVILRLMVILHLTANPGLTALERNDWVVSLALPVVGFGAAFAYTIKNMVPWAFTALAWLFVLTLTGKAMASNITNILLPAGEQRREEFRLEHPPVPVFRP